MHYKLNETNMAYLSGEELGIAVLTLGFLVILGHTK